MKRIETLEELQASLGPGAKIKSIDSVLVEPVKAAPAKSPGIKGIIRQSNTPPNKTEIRFENDYLRPMLHSGEIQQYRHNSIRLKLGNGAWYKCDWTALNAAGKLVLWEIKGGRPRQREAGIMAIKVAASAYPEFEFWLCRWKGGEWNIQRVLP